MALMLLSERQRHKTSKLNFGNTADGIESVWEKSGPLLAAPPPLHRYAAGSWGPDAMRDLIAPDVWRLPFERPWRSGDLDAR